MKLNHLSATRLDSGETKFHVVATTTVVKGYEANVLAKLQAVTAKAIERFEADYTATPAGIIGPLFVSPDQRTFDYLRAFGSGLKLAATLPDQTLDQVRTAVSAQTDNVPNVPAKARVAGGKLLSYYASEATKSSPDAVAAEIVSVIDSALEVAGWNGVD